MNTHTIMLIVQALASAVVLLAAFRFAHAVPPGLGRIRPPNPVAANCQSFAMQNLGGSAASVDVVATGVENR